MVHANGAASSLSSRRGRRRHPPTTELGTFIQEQLDSIGMTRSKLAALLHVSPSTIGRLLNGDTKVIQRVSGESICDALGLDDMKRRDFLRLVSAAGTFALATGATAPKTTKYRVDLDMANDYADALGRLMHQSEVKYVMEKAQQWYNKLLQEQPSAKDTRYAATQIRFGIILGYTQEVVFPWYQRSSLALRTYDNIEQSIINRFELNTFRQEYANLLSHSAPLYRELGAYDESARQFEDGIYWLRNVDDPLLRANLYRSRAHISAVQGNELQWANQLDAARRDTQGMNTVYKEEAFGLIDYVEGEGFKRLAFNIQRALPLSVRVYYAKRALQSFSVSRHRTQQHPLNHHMLVRVSEAQCLTWIDPEEAILHAEQLRKEAMLFYPALLDKINRAIYFASQRLLAHSRDPLPLFDLDAHLYQPPQIR